MTGVVLAWLVVTIGYICVRAMESLNFENDRSGLIVYGIVVLTVEVSSLRLLVNSRRCIPVLHE